MRIVDRSPALLVRADEPLSRATKLLYGVGGIAEAVKSALFALYTLFFYSTVMGLPGTWVGLATAVGLVWDAAIDPYIGYLSDRTRSRWGRRHLFMLVGALLMGVSFWAFFSPPQGLSRGMLFVWLLGSSLLVRTMTSIYNIPYYALGAEVSEDYHERTTITAIRGMLGLLGTMAAAALSFVLFFPNVISEVDPKLNYDGYPAMGLTFGAMMTIAGLISVFGTLSWRRVRTEVAATRTTLRHFLAGFAQSMRLRSFRLFFFSFSLFFLAIVINQVLAIHYFTYYVAITDSVELSTFQTLFYTGAVIGLGGWFVAAKVMEKHHLYLLSTLLTALLMFSAYFLIGEGRLFGTGNPQPLMIGHFLAGIFGSIIWFMPASMLADVADEDELATGERREGAFFGMYFFGQQVAAGLALLLTGALLDTFAGLVPGQASQSALTTQRIGFLYGVPPAILTLCAAWLVYRYPLTRTRLADIQRALNRVAPNQPHSFN